MVFQNYLSSHVGRAFLYHWVRTKIQNLLETWFKSKFINLRKILFSNTGDTDSLDRCRQKYQYLILAIHPSIRSVQDTQIWVLFNFKKKFKLFIKILPSFYEYSFYEYAFYEYAIWPEVSTTPVRWCFPIIRIIFSWG